MTTRDSNAPILATLVDETPRGVQAHGENFWALLMVTFLATTTVGTLLIVRLRGNQEEDSEQAPVAQPAETLQLEGRPEIDRRVFPLLAAGDQSKAEELLTHEVASHPAALKFSRLLLEGKRAEAERYLKKNVSKLRPEQRTLFLLAACQRSRFDLAASFPLFTAVWAIDPATPGGQCAAKVLELDNPQFRSANPEMIEQAFAGFHALADEHADDVMIRWMLAVECRHWDRNVDGAEQYKKILEQWNPGPVLAHQSYANLLDNLGRYQQALDERSKAVKMEPASWSYDGLANTLNKLHRYDEAGEAHAMAVKLNPKSSSHWTNWAVSLNDDGKFSAAAEKCQRAVELDDSNWRAWWMWGKSLDGQGDAAGALAKYRRALALNPAATFLAPLVTELERKSGQQVATP